MESWRKFGSAEDRWQPDPSRPENSKRHLWRAAALFDPYCPALGQLGTVPRAFGQSVAHFSFGGFKEIQA